MNLKAVLEGILFVVGDEGISFEKKKKILEISDEELRKLILEYKYDLNGLDRGFQLEEYNNNYKLVTKKEHAHFYKNLVTEEVSDKLSPAALETLAIIAYNGPITRMMVDEIRGVSSVYVMRKLVLKNLIKEAGKSSLPGKPTLYKVTDYFLDYFGLKSLDDLPEIKQESSGKIMDLYDTKYRDDI